MDAFLQYGALGLVLFQSFILMGIFKSLHDQIKTWNKTQNNYLNSWMDYSQETAHTLISLVKNNTLAFIQVKERLEDLIMALKDHPNQKT